MNDTNWAEFIAGESEEIEFVNTPDGKFFIDPPVKATKGNTYRLDWNKAQARVWELKAVTSEAILVTH